MDCSVSGTERGLGMGRWNPWKSPFIARREVTSRLTQSVSLAIRPSAAVARRLAPKQDSHRGIEPRYSRRSLDRIVVDFEIHCRQIRFHHFGPEARSVVRIR